MGERRGRHGRGSGCVRSMGTASLTRGPRAPARTRCVSCWASEGRDRRKCAWIRGLARPELELWAQDPATVKLGPATLRLWEGTRPLGATARHAAELDYNHEVAAAGFSGRCAPPDRGTTPRQRAQRGSARTEDGQTARRARSRRARPREPAARETESHQDACGDVLALVPSEKQP